jgi:hypothetical protein
MQAKISLNNRPAGEGGGSTILAVRIVLKFHGVLRRAGGALRMTSVGEAKQILPSAFHSRRDFQDVLLAEVLDSGQG